jgi:hypothetical protein
MGPVLQTSSNHLAIPSKSRNIHVILYHLVTSRLRSSSSPAVRILMRNLQLPRQTAKHDTKTSASTALGA